MGPRKASEWLELPGRSATDASYVKKVMGVYQEIKEVKGKEEAEKQKSNAEEFLQKLLLKLTVNEQTSEIDIPKLVFNRRIEVESKEDAS